MNFTSIPDLLLKYIDYNYLLGGLFVFALLWLIIKAFHHDKIWGFAALSAIFIPFLTVLNPLIFEFLTPCLEDNASYYRFLWAFPLVILGACLLTDMVTKIFRGLSSHFRKNSTPAKILPAAVSTAAALLLCAAILFSGTSYLTAKNLTMPENKFTISRATLDIAQFIHTDPDFDGKAVILGPTEIVMELQAYDTSIQSALPRSEYLNYASQESVHRPLLTVVLEGQQRGADYMKWNLYSLKVDYIAALTLFHLDGYMEDLGYPVYNRTGDYTLYKRADK